MCRTTLIYEYFFLIFENVFFCFFYSVGSRKLILTTDILVRGGLFEFQILHCSFPDRQDYHAVRQFNRAKVVPRFSLVLVTKSRTTTSYIGRSVEICYFKAPFIV